VSSVCESVVFGLWTLLLEPRPTYGDTALKKSAVYDWFSRFKNGQEMLEDDQRSGRPSTSRTEEMIGKVRQLISTCKFCRGCAMRFGGSGATSGRDSGFCITITHRATHRLLCRTSWPRQTFLSSLSHRTLRIALRVTFGCSLL
jgi:hypothetical protein